MRKCFPSKNPYSHENISFKLDLNPSTLLNNYQHFSYRCSITFLQESCCTEGKNKTFKTTSANKRKISLRLDARIQKA